MRATIDRAAMFGVTVMLIGTLALAQAAQRIEMKNAQGEAVGTAMITARTEGGVEIALDLKGLPAGEHALPFHQTARCEAPDFTSAGSHFNPTNKNHGAQNPEGPRAGDMNNFTVATDGTAKTTIGSVNVSLGHGANSLLANGGTALIVHAAPDDMKTDPAGNAGARIACGVIPR
jgi:Cu-Zn family superoxide dismutase